MSIAVWSKMHRNNIWIIRLLKFYDANLGGISNHGNTIVNSLNKKTPLLWATAVLQSSKVNKYIC